MDNVLALVKDFVSNHVSVAIMFMAIVTAGVSNMLGKFFELRVESRGSKLALLLWGVFSTISAIMGLVFILALIYLLYSLLVK